MQCFFKRKCRLCLHDEQVERQIFILRKIRELYKNGLSKEAILKSLTENPAKIVKSEANLGNLRKEVMLISYYLLKIYSAKMLFYRKIGWQEKISW